MTRELAVAMVPTAPAAEVAPVTALVLWGVAIFLFGFGLGALIEQWRRRRFERRYADWFAKSLGYENVRRQCRGRLLR